MPSQVHGIEAARVHKTIRLLIQQLVSIQDTTGEFLLPLPDGRIIDTKSWNTDSWEWTHGIGLYGIWKYYQLTADESLRTLIEDWFSARLAAGGTTKNINTIAVFLTLACLYEKTRNEAYRPWLETWAEWAMYELPRTRFGGMQHATYLTENHQQLWDDTLMMTVMPLAKVGKLLGRPEYVEEAKRQFLTHITYLFDRRSGLFFHGWQFNDKGSDSAGLGHNFADARWARGNSWITIVIPEFLELIEDDLSPNDSFRTHLLDVLEAQCGSLAELQEPSGMWRTLLDHPASEGSYPEASATAGFAYGILKARRKAYLRRDPASGIPPYEPLAVNAAKAILDNVTEDGELLDVSFGTGMGDSLQFYKDIKKTSMPYGQAMAIMALGEFARAFI